MPRKSRRVWGASTVALVIAVGVTTLPAVPVQADNTITAADQPYFAYYHLDQARAKGHTGEGVTIAMIDGGIAQNAAELVSADVVIKTPCTIGSPATGRTHGTGVASMLISSNYDIAPDASLLAYRVASGAGGDTTESDCRDNNGVAKSEYPWLLDWAMNDGAQVISVSASSSPQSDELKWVIARSLSQGVIIAVAVGNEATDGDTTALSQWSGIVGVSAIGIDGNRQDYSPWGQGVSTTAVGGPVKFRDLSADQLIEVSGTSVSAPIIAGVLAPARQKQSNATSGQLLQLPVGTGLNPNHTWDQYTGYGGIDPGAILNTDPTTLPGVSLLTDRGNGSSPTVDEVQQYADGIVSPLQIVNDNSYSYRSFDESLITDPLVTALMHPRTSPRCHVK